MQTRCVRLVMLVSITVMLVTPALAAEEKGAPGTAPSATEFCIYLDGHTDTPETGPLPCETSRRYMLGTTEFGTSRVGPQTPTNSTEGSDSQEGTSASPGAPEVNGGQSTHTEAP